MSTQVNITVGDDTGLLERSKQEQTANRQAQLEKEADERLKDQAIDAVVSEQQKAGKDAQGRPLYASRYEIPEIDKRVAATPRSKRYDALLTAPFTYSDYGGSHSGLTVRCRGNRNVPASRFSYEEDKAYPEGVVVQGPAESTFALEPAPAPNQPEPVYYYGQRQDNGEFLGWLNYDQASTEIPVLICRYAVQNQPYNTVLNWQRGALVLEIPQPPYNVEGLDGELQEISNFRALNTIKTFTSEFIIRLPADAYNDTGAVSYVVTNSAPVRTSGVDVDFGGITLRIFCQDVWAQTDAFLIQGTTPSPFSFVLYEFTRQSNFDATFILTAPAFTPSTGNTVSLAGIGPGSFVHCALTRSFVDNAPRWTAYLNGTPVFNVQEPSIWTQTYGTQPPSVALRLFSNRSPYASNVLPVPALHAVRFTPKVLYTGAFTPPTSITTFA